MRKGSPLTLCNHFIQPYIALDTLFSELLTLDGTKGLRVINSVDPCVLKSNFFRL